MTLDYDDDPYELYYLKNQENHQQSCAYEQYESLMYYRSLKPEVYPVLKPIAPNPNSVTGKRCNENSDGNESKKRTRD